MLIFLPPPPLQMCVAGVMVRSESPYGAIRGAPYLEPSIDACIHGAHTEGGPRIYIHIYIYIYIYIMLTSSKTEEGEVRMCSYIAEDTLPKRAMSQVIRTPHLLVAVHAYQMRHQKQKNKLEQTP